MNPEPDPPVSPVRPPWATFWRTSMFTTDGRAFLDRGRDGAGVCVEEDVVGQCAIGHLSLLRRECVKCVRGEAVAAKSLVFWRVFS